MKFTITAGHSDKDPGAFAQGMKEADLAVQLRDILSNKLRDMGHTVTEDGADGVNLPLSTAVTLIKGSDKAVEIHFNAASSPLACGVETIALPKDKALAQNISSAIACTLGTKLRGDKGFIDQSKSARGKLGFVSNGGLIIEVCFITNKAEMDSYQDRKWLVASAITRVLDEWSKS